ncbi:hypothetical protein QPK13_07560 [Photorhabdus tasmaniensis]|uniref:hypothetical protein n=1 Tax=Photorhabdus sp. RM323S TaxID=3342828 RepID=UPI0036D8A746
MTRPHDSTSGAFREADVRTLFLVREVGTSYAVDFDSSRVMRSASETRPHNIAFNYVVRVA